ncbi:hypothetical protein B0H13DRAFT_1894369 [Mycena leptocephala]|nr:hypothetical protein B0H13DRAFT_1894369 [Mycena leptocephala]
MLDTVDEVEGVAMCDVILADLYLRDRNSLAAKTVLKKCLEITLEYSQIQTFCLERLGDASCWGDVDGMSCWTVVYLVNSLKRKEKLGIFKALQSLGDIFLYQNDEHTATNLWMSIVAELNACFDSETFPWAWQPAQGSGFLGWSKTLFERSSQAKQVNRINERLANISKDVLKQHRNLAHLPELNAQFGTVEELEADLSDIEDLDKVDIGDEKELDLIVA